MGWIQIFYLLDRLNSSALQTVKEKIIDFDGIDLVSNSMPVGDRIFKVHLYVRGF